MSGIKPRRRPCSLTEKQLLSPTPAASSKRGSGPRRRGHSLPHDILPSSTGKRRAAIPVATNPNRSHRSQRRRDQRTTHGEDHHRAGMLRKVKVEFELAITNLLARQLMDRFPLSPLQPKLRNWPQVRQTWRHRFSEGTIGPKEAFEQTNAEVKRWAAHACQGKPLQRVPAPRAPVARDHPKARSAAPNQFSSVRHRFQETTKVLTKPPLAGKVDKLVGLKEN